MVLNNARELIVKRERDSEKKERKRKGECEMVDMEQSEDGFGSLKLKSSRWKSRI